jgi:hypothetical protein
MVGNSGDINANRKMHRWNGWFSNSIELTTFGLATGVPGFRPPTERAVLSAVRRSNSDA